MFRLIVRLRADRLLALLVVVALVLSGCGTIKSRSATEQLLVSDAVDQSIAQIDFSSLSGSTVYLDTKFIKQVRGTGFVNADYIVAALRERIMFSGCVLQDSRDQAEYIVEVRVGALGTDGHEITYGIPASQTLNATANLVASSPLMPSIPEISLAKRDERRAEVKLGVFAYRRESKQPVWQPGLVQGRSMAKATWFLGAGPFEQGNIYESVHLAGQPVPALESPAIATLANPAKWVQNIASVTLPKNMRTTEAEAMAAETPQAETPAVQRLGMGNVVATNTPQATPTESAAATTPAATTPVEAQSQNQVAQTQPPPTEPTQPLEPAAEAAAAPPAEPATEAPSEQVVSADPNESQPVVPATYMGKTAE